MERLTVRTWRRGSNDDSDSGPDGSTWRRREDTAGDTGRGMKCRRKTESRGGAQGHRDKADRRGDEGMRWRGRGGRGRGGGRDEGLRRGSDWRGGRGEERSSQVGARQERRGGLNTGGGLGFKTLQELAEKEPSVVAITLSSKPALQEMLGQTSMRQDLVGLLCLVLSKAFKSRSDRSTLQHLAGHIKDSGFLRSVLPNYLAGMMSESDPVRRETHPQHLENILVVLTEVLSIFPASSVQTVSMILTLLQASINYLRTSGMDIQPHIEQNLEKLQDLVKHLQERSRDGTLRSDKDNYALLTGDYNPDGEDVQDFRTIPIYPTPEEFQQEQRPFLRPNLTSQRYANTHLYLDTHFRLLREDFVRPLREGIQQFLQNQMEVGRGDNRLRAKRFDDIRVYFDTQLVDSKCTPTGFIYVAKFDTEPLKFVRWQNSKRLLYGSLVCLSCDNFESFLFATVTDRDPEKLMKGLVEIAFTEESRDKLARIENNQLFLMVETTAYFEAYRYVLEGLQEQEEEELPFQRYIVGCSTDVQPPAYLVEGDTYNLSATAVSDYKETIKPFHILEPEAWPSMEELGFDESQMKAFQVALTTELAIIQGPPGTGKTYVGLKIAEALLTNQNLAKGRDESSPMLVVCYTNHALDQFLEGIHKFLKRGIVRVGGRSNSEVLKRFNLRELIQLPSFRDTRPRHLSAAYGKIMQELREEEENILSQKTQLECSQKGILREAFLLKHISINHRKSLQTMAGYYYDPVRKQKLSLIMEWLGLGFTVFLQRATQDAKNTEATMEVTEDDDFIEIPEIADLIERERYIDDSCEPGGRKAEQREAEKERFVKKLKEEMLAVNLDQVEIQAEQDEQAFQLQRRQKRNLKKQIKDEFKETSVMTEEEEKSTVDVWSLSRPDRWRLYRLWVARYRTELRTKALESEQAYQNSVDRLADVKRHESLCVLKKATVIGMTTTGAAKFRKALQEVRPRLVIVEEAAEVLEAHTITTLSQACQHLILIGDHQQLRPSATVYELAKNFNLEMSMFERLVNMKIPFIRLNFQHRMRPDIARLLTPHIYSELENHPSVLTYDNIKGLKTNLFFVEHNHPEEEIKDGKSHQNKHEALFVVALCRYLLLQDYQPEQITILTTYTGQLHCLRKLMPASHFTGVKVHVVDKYQGEENDIVLLSLVRSNTQGKVGFLKIPNRVCVALSRAKKGLYCIGNSVMLGQVKLWSNIFHTLREKGQIGTALTLCCHNHPNIEVKAACADDFKQAPEGGCTQPCEFRLDCGHVCARVCHPYDPEHKRYKCGKKCPKILCDVGHPCPLVCHETCPEKCPIKVEKIIPQCQHKQMVPCHQDPETFECKEPCQKMLECGHPCDSFCGTPCSRRCLVKVTLKLKCGHTQEGACFYKNTENDPQCRTACEHQLKCGHNCRGTCHNCHQGRYHMPCPHQCKRLLICSHQCRENCTRNCPPCRMPCENRCIHSKCMNPCGYPCTPCKEPCAWNCPHQSCSKFCHEPCDRPPCTKPCTEILTCGHPCIGLCGDKCPNKCRICNHDEVTEIFFGTEDDPDASFIQLEDCGHIFESTGMDKFMGIDDDQQANEEEQVVIKLKQCPRCLTPIRKNLRYGSHINQSLAEIEMVKKKVHGDPKDIKENKQALKKEWHDNIFINGMHQLAEYMHIGTFEHPLSAHDLWVLENKMHFLIRLIKLENTYKNKALTRTLGLRNLKLDVSSQTRFQRKVEEYRCWLNHPEQRFTDQQLFDLQRELIRLILLAELDAHCLVAKNRGESEKMESDAQAIRGTLEKSGQFTEEDESQVKDALQELNKRFPVAALGISDDERKMIVSAMKMRPGHWYKCPNGHVYVITECGGAMEKRKCPDCDATIGGSNHALVNDNQVATEMDGAAHAAWSEANNLLNFDEFD